MQNVVSGVPHDENARILEIHMGSEVKYKHHCVAPKVTKIAGGTGYLLLKRVFDIVVSFVMMVLLAIPMLVIAILIKLDSPGTVLYKQERLGKNGRPIMILKFRSMHMDAEKMGAQWASSEDPRTTRIGAFLRKCRLDELPQLFCIFIGDMSFIGPRPERKVFYDEFAKYIDGFEQRMLIEPGLTGLAQVCGGYDLEPEEKIVYDVQYIETRSVWTDIKILFKTVSVVFTHHGAR